MPPLQRFLRFNLVGLLGAGVQLTTLALLNHMVVYHYLLSSAATLEIALLHNLTWHLHYTWRDRIHDTSRCQQLLRFHFANGLISLLGNLGLMRLLVHTARLPVVAANALAILLCSLINFALANLVVFAAPGKERPDNATAFSYNRHRGEDGEVAETVAIQAKRLHMG